MYMNQNIKLHTLTHTIPIFQFYLNKAEKIFKTKNFLKMLKKYSYEHVFWGPSAYFYVEYIPTGRSFGLNGMYMFDFMFFQL